MKTGNDLATSFVRGSFSPLMCINFLGKEKESPLIKKINKTPTNKKIVLCLPRVPCLDKKWEFAKFNLHIGLKKQLNFSQNNILIRFMSILCKSLSSITAKSH